MKRKYFYSGVLLLALSVLLLLPVGIAQAKYATTLTQNVTLTVEMAADPVLDSTWATQLTPNANTIVVDSFNNQKSNISSGWESGIPIGMKSGDNYTNGVRLFAKDNSGSVTAYILAEGDGSVIFPQSSASLFAKLTQVTSITFGRIDTSSVTTMAAMFSGCSALTTLDLSGFDTGNVTYMDSMFDGCNALEEITLSKSFGSSTASCYLPGNLSTTWYPTDKGLGNYETNTTIQYYLNILNPQSITTVTLTPYLPILSQNWITKLRDNTQCATLNIVISNYQKYANDVGGWHSDKAINIGQGSSNMTSSVKLFVCEDTETAYVLAMGNRDVIFPENSSNLFKPNGIGYDNMYLVSFLFEYIDTSSVTNMSGMFSYCYALTELDFSNFNTSNVTNMSDMFRQSSSLQTLDLSNFDTSSVTNMSGMFRNCERLQTLNLSGFSTSSVTDMSDMFSGCGSLATLDLGNFVTTNVADMSDMFGGCWSLATLDLGNFVTTNVTDMSGMFGGCWSLTTLNLSNFDTLSADNMTDMFLYCDNLSEVTLSPRFCFGHGTSLPKKTWCIDDGTIFDTAEDLIKYHNERCDEGGEDSITYFAQNNYDPNLLQSTFSIQSQGGTITTGTQTTTTSEEG